MMLFYIILFLIILAIVIWGGVTQWKFVPKKKKYAQLDNSKQFFKPKSSDIMKNIISWTQTHGDKRILNMQLLEYDTIGNYFRNKCKYIIFSFHNCPDHIYDQSIKILKNIYNQEKLILLRFNNCSYLKCWKNIIIKCKNLNCSDILRFEDDHHGINSNENINNLKDIDDIIETYISNENIDLLGLLAKEAIPKPNLIPIETIKINNVELYKYDSRDFQKCNQYAWHHGTCIININLIEYLLNLKNIPNDAWGIEVFLKSRFDNNKFYRYGTNKYLFSRSNLYGKNINPMAPEENLFRFFGETVHWDKIKNLIK